MRGKGVPIQRKILGIMTGRFENRKKGTVCGQLSKPKSLNEVNLKKKNEAQ